MKHASAAVARRAVHTAGVTAPGDKRFRRPDVRPARRRLSWWSWKVGSAVLGVAAIAGAGYAAAGFALRSRLFLVSRVAIEGNTRLPAGELDVLSNEIRGQQIFQVDLEAYRRRLTSSPWVADAIVRRVLPGTIEVHLVERAPMAIARINSRLYLVDQTGIIMDEFGPAYRDFDLPIVDGLAPVGAASPAVDPARAAAARQFLDAVRPVGALRQRVSQIDVSNDHDVVVLLGEDPTLVHLGEGNFVERLKRYQELAPTLQDQLHEIDYVDMRFDERVYVKSSRSRGASGPEQTKKRG